RQTGAFYRWSERFFLWLNDTYRRTLQVVLRHRRATLLASIALTVVTVYMFVLMPKGFMPTVDQGFAFGGAEAAEDTSFDEMTRLQRKINNVVRKNPWIDFYVSGTGGFAGQNQGFLFVSLRNDKHRPKVNGIIGQLEM